MIQKIFNFIKEKKDMIDCLQKNADYLCSGSYVFDDTIKYLVFDHPETKKKSLELFQKHFYRKAANRFFVYILRKTLFKRRILIHKKSSTLQRFSGTVYLPVGSSNGYSDKKIFDFTNRKVMSIFNDQKAYQLVISNYEYFKDYFPQPSIFWTNDEKRLIVEELISSRPINTTAEDDYLLILYDVFERYYNYLSMCEAQGRFSSINTSVIVNSLNDCSKIEFIWDYINPELLQMKIPRVKLHGDLWTSNTLIVKSNYKQITYIDWEFSSDLLFFYDFFNMMWIEAYMNNQYIYINKYLEGEFDSEFKRIFSLFDLPFKTQNRLDYLHLYFLNFCSERLIHFEEEDQLPYVNHYKRIIEKVQMSSLVDY